MEVEVNGSTSKKLKNCIKELGVVISTAINVENNTARDILCINEGFRFPIRFLKTEVGQYKRKKNKQGRKGG